MATLADMKVRIALEIARDDLTTQIANAITDAISVYQAEHFRFNEVDPAAPPTFNTVINQTVYSAADLPAIATLFKIDQLTYQQATSTFEILRRQPGDIRLALQGNQMKGPPEEFAYQGNKLYIFPAPDLVYPVSISDAYLSFAAPASDLEANNVWMNDAEMLIRCRSKYEIALHITRNDKMAMAMSTEETGGQNGGPGATFMAWQALKGEYNRVVSTGRVAAMQF